MPRKARKISGSSYHHVIVQGINKDYIFKRAEDIEKFKEIIISKLKDVEIEILAYCIMNNHAHFLIFSKTNEALSKFMQRVNTSYSKYYNRGNKRVGYVFRDRYYSQDILSHKQLYNCLKYIHNNPVKAGIIKNVGDYKYSSYNEFLGKRKIITNEGLKLLFGTTDGFEEEFYKIHEPKVYEDEKFYDLKEKNILELIGDFEKEYGKAFEELKNDKKVLKKIIKVAREETNVTITELAKLVGVSKSSVGNYINK